MRKVLAILGLLTISFSAKASNLSSMIEVLQTAKSVGADSKCDFTVAKEASLPIKGGENFPTYSLSLSIPRDDGKEAFVHKVLLVNEPTLEIGQTKIGVYTFVYTVSVLATAQYPKFTTLQITANADGTLRSLSGSKTEYYLGSPPKTMKTLECN